MKKLHGKWNSGFTVIELMIVVMLIAILVALAYPSYVDYVRKAKRGEAQQLLLNWSINQEIFRSNNSAYAPDSSTVLPKPTHASYTFSATGVSATAYSLVATASGDQANDKAKDGTSCSPIQINQNGTKSPTVCWD